MSVLFSGYYGKMNTGDDVFCVVSEWAAKKYWNENNISFLARNLPVAENNERLKSSFYLKRHIKGVSFVDTFVQGLRNEIIVYSGGSLFHSTPKFLSESFFLTKSRLFKKTKVAAIGVSIGPFKSKKAFIYHKKYLKSFDFLSLRDKKSFEIAMSMDLDIPIVEAFDLAAFLPDIYNDRLTLNSNSKKLVIGISLCNSDVLNDDEVKKTIVRNNRISEYANKLIEQIENIEFKLLVFNGNRLWGDENITQEFKNKLSRKVNSNIIHYSNNPFNMWQAINDCDFILSTRLHAGIFSYFSKKPFIQIEYHRKCSDFLDEIDFPNELRVGDFEGEIDDLISKTIMVIEKRETLYHRYNLLTKKAMLNFTEATKYLK